MPRSAAKVRDQLVEFAIADVDVRVAKQRRQVVGVRAQSRVLEVDDVELALMQHEVAAVIVAMTEDARLGGQFLDDARPIRPPAPSARPRDRITPR